jgi:hypothetical protein
MHLVISIIGCYVAITPTVTREIERNISVYPNPFNNLLTICKPTTNKGVEIQIFDIQGKPVLAKTHVVDQCISINTSAIPNGVYVIQIIGEKSLRRKIVKISQ